MSDGNSSTTTAVAIAGRDVKPLSRDIIKEIALDIGKEVASHIETMYPNAVKATSKNMLLSVRGCVINEIMAALDTIDEAEILARLELRRKHRRSMRAAYRHIRDQPLTEDVINDVETAGNRLETLLEDDLNAR